MAKRKRSAHPKRASQQRAKTSRPKRIARKGRPKRQAAVRRRLPTSSAARPAKRPQAKGRRPARRVAARRPAKSTPRRSGKNPTVPAKSIKPSPPPPTARVAKPVRPQPPASAAAAAAKPKPVRAPRVHAGKPALDRNRRRLSDDERGNPPQPGDDRLLASVKSGGDELKHLLERHTEASPALTAGDMDANWGDAYAVGDEAPGGDNPTPDQDRVDDIGKALGVNYDEGEELIGAEKIEERDRHRWELDPASSDDWPHDRD